MMKAIVRTGAALGTMFFVGYVAKRYFGWNPDDLFAAGEGDNRSSGGSMGLKKAPRDDFSTSRTTI